MLVQIDYDLKISYYEVIDNDLDNIQEFIKTLKGTARTDFYCDGSGKLQSKTLENFESVENLFHQLLPFAYGNDQPCEFHELLFKTPQKWCTLVNWILGSITVAINMDEDFNNFKIKDQPSNQNGIIDLRRAMKRIHEKAFETKPNIKYTKALRMS